MNDLSVTLFGANELGSHLMRAMTIDRSWTWKLGVRKRQVDSSGSAERNQSDIAHEAVLRRRANEHVCNKTS